MPMGWNGMGLFCRRNRLLNSGLTGSTLQVISPRKTPNPAVWRVSLSVLCASYCIGPSQEGDKSVGDRFWMLSHRISYSAGSASAVYGFRGGGPGGQSRTAPVPVKDGHSAEYEVPIRIPFFPSSSSS